MLFESKAVGVNQSGYDTLENIINSHASNTYKRQNQIFAFGYYDNDNLFNNFNETDDLYDVMLRSDYMVWITTVKPSKSCPIPKHKIDTFISENIWKSSTTTKDIQSKTFHVSDSLKQAAETFDGFGKRWQLSGGRRSFAFETVYKTTFKKRKVGENTILIRKLECGLDHFDPDYPVLKRFFNDHPELKQKCIDDKWFPLDFIIRERFGDPNWRQEKDEMFQQLRVLFDKTYDYDLTHQQRGNLHKLFFKLRYLWGSQVDKEKGGLKETEGLRADVDDVPVVIIKILTKLVSYGLISEEEIFNIFAVNKYDDWVGLRSHYDDKFIKAIWSFLLGTPSRMSFGVVASECGMGLCTIELPEGATTEMSCDGFSGKYPKHKIKDEHIIGPRLCALFRCVEQRIYDECYKNQANKLKRKKRKRL